MKLRLRSLETNETTRVEIADSSSLLDLKTLIAGKLSSSSSIPPQSFVLSLNRMDELVASSPSDSLPALGLTSGDLIFYSQTQSPTPPSGTPISEMGTASISAQMDVQPAAETLGHVPDSEPTIDSKMEIETPSVGKSSSVSCFLKRIIELNVEEIKDNTGLLVVAVHAVFLDSGFVVCNESGSRLPKDWDSAATAVSIRYTVPELISPVRDRDVKAATVKFSVMRNHGVVYGGLSGEADVYRLHLDLSEVVKLARVSSIALNEEEEKGVFGFLKIVKDSLCFPLLIDICQKYGLPLPPCFARLPAELKLKIVELLPGVDVARIGCTCSDMRRLTMNDDLWKQKTMEELVPGIAAVSSWKDEFKWQWLLRKEARNLMRGPPMEIRRSFERGWMPSYLDMPRMAPSGGFRPVGRGFGYRGRLERRNFSPYGDLGGWPQ